eukprot:6043060-Amphidinium_carterae.1
MWRSVHGASEEGLQRIEVQHNLHMWDGPSHDQKMRVKSGLERVWSSMCEYFQVYIATLKHLRWYTSME